MELAFEVRREVVVAVLEGHQEVVDFVGHRVEEVMISHELFFLQLRS